MKKNLIKQLLKFPHFKTSTETETADVPRRHPDKTHESITCQNDAFTPHCR